jgi:hypothetical protein
MVKNTGWRLRQDGRRCFTVQQDVNRHCFTMRQDVDRRCVVMQQGVGRRCNNLIHQFLWLEMSRHSTRQWATEKAPLRKRPPPVNVSLQFRTPVVRPVFGPEVGATV